MMTLTLITGELEDVEQALDRLHHRVIEHEADERIRSAVNMALCCVQDALNAVIEVDEDEVPVE
jgi:hypothetical protein